MTITAMMSMISASWRDHIPTLPHYLVRDWPTAGITTPLRMIHYLAQASVETMGFTRLREMGDAMYFAHYDGRKDLGNTSKGDGARYCGRGIFQVTGRANYKELGLQLGLNLLDDPELLEEPDLASRSAAQFWRDRGINRFADADNAEMVTRRVNGGLNG